RRSIRNRDIVKRRVSQPKPAVAMESSRRGSLALRRPGNGLLSQVLRHSTIGAKAFDGRGRDGIGAGHSAKGPRPPEGRIEANWRAAPTGAAFAFQITSNAWASTNESVQANRAISTGKLHTLLCFHARPINVVVFHGSRGSTGFEVGFPLRCLQRLSRPHIATLLCRWRDNRSTRGASIPVLSY